MLAKGGLDSLALGNVSLPPGVQNILLSLTSPSTQGTEVPGNNAGVNAGAVARAMKKTYKNSARQYMNRKGGFNRPLAKNKDIFFLERLDFLDKS